MRQTLSLQAIATLLVLLVAFTSQSAHANNSPMSFSLYYGRGEEERDCQQREDGRFDCAVIARGIIKADTAKRFRDFLAKAGVDVSTATGVTVLLDSEGGDVSNALEMGKLIRSYRMNTKLVRAEGSRQVCRGTDDYSLFKATDYNFIAPKCYDFLYSEQPANCRSACTLVFMAGISRSLERNVLFAMLNGRPDERLNWLFDGTEYGDQQSQLGFHPIQPASNPNVPKEVRQEVLKFGAVWGQQESAKILSYMKEMGLENDALSFFTGDGTARVGPDGYYYPSVSLLQRAGILAGSNFGPFILKVISKNSAKPGLALVANRSSWNNAGTQLSLFCQQAGDHPDQMFAIVSIPYSAQSQSDYPPEINVETIDLNYRKPDKTNRSTTSLPVIRSAPPPGASLHTFGWRFTVNVDGKRLVDLGWIESATEVRDERKVGFPADSLALHIGSSAAEASVVWAKHFAVALNSEVVSAIVRGHILEFGLAPNDRNEIVPLLKVETDDAFRARLALLPGNCIP